MSVRHQNGLGSAERFKEFAPEIMQKDLPDLTFEATTIHFCLVEIPVAESLRVLPPSLHPSIPGMVGCIHYKSSHEDFGDFDFVVIGLLCRSGVKPRLMTTAAFTNNAGVRDYLSATWGFPFRMADVRLRVNYDRVRSVVALDSRTLLDFEVDNPIPLTGAGGSVRYPQCFNIVRDKNGLKFAQVDVSYGFERVARGKPKISRCDPGLVDGIDLGGAYPVAGTIVGAKMTLHPVRYLADVEIPAEDGGVVSQTKA